LQHLWVLFYVITLNVFKWHYADVILQEVNKWVSELPKINNNNNNNNKQAVQNDQLTD